MFCMKTKFFANLALFLTALIWGLSFVAQKAGMEYVGPFTFNSIRSIIGGISLIPVISLVKLMQTDTRTREVKHKQHIMLAKAGICCGLALFLAMTIQQICMTEVSAGKAGFICSLYIIYVPLISMLFLGHKLRKNVICSVFLALIGLYLLCFKQDYGGFSYYDILLLISAFFYGVHILVVNYFSEKVNAVKASCIQFFVVGFLSMPFMFLLETPTVYNIIACKLPLFFAGVLTCGVAYTLQIFGQRHTAPVIASLILCLESVFAVLGGIVILNEVMTVKEGFGCILMITAVILSKLRFGKKCL